MAEKQRLEGNELFKASSFQEAILRYQKAHANLAKMFDLSPDDAAEKGRVSLSCYLNTAQCYLKGIDREEQDAKAKGIADIKKDGDAKLKDKLEQLGKKVVRACDDALEVDAKSVKALYRKGLALEKLGDADSGRQCTKVALGVEAENAEVIRLDKRLERMQLIEKQKAKKTFGKMFG